MMVIMWVSDFETAGLAAITLSASVATAPAANASERASRLAADRCLLLM